ncbi:hypothetical protein BamMEX5DRAFT_5243 [Burkholderia ambifaria MEX-5]|uniref:Uncharacterized protein n=1 Tax=Burkholderia ambifaria MEX-5 TaxID=396597 RepID=B1TBS7_9BURK|nr:hypothetical protein BamMEX5DRAFT_5243 [Burkholderia ambifaria MEX-5]
MIDRVAQQVHEHVLQRRADLAAHAMAVAVDMHDGRRLAEFGRERRQRFDHAAQRVANALRAELSQQAAHRIARREPVARVRRICAVEHAQALADMRTLDHQVVAAARPRRLAVAAERDRVDRRVVIDRLAHAGQVVHQRIAVPLGAAVRAAQRFVRLLRFMHDVGQVLKAVGARIALDRVHVAEQRRDDRVIRAFVLADHPLVLAEEALRAVHEVMELVLADRQNLADHLEAALLLAGLRGQLADLGHVAHAQHQPHDRVGLVGDRRPAQVKPLLAAVQHPLRDFVDEQVLVEREVHAVLAEACMHGCLDLRARVGADARSVEYERHQVASGDVARLEDGLEVSRILRMHDAAFDDGQDSLLHVLQHRLDVGRLLLQLRGVLLDLLDHPVERDDRMTDLVHPAHRHAAREVLARRDLAHRRLHPDQRARDLTVQHEAERGQQHDHRARDSRDRGRRGRQHAVQRADRVVLLAVLLDAQRVDDAFEFVAILRDVREQVSLRHLRLAVGLHLHGIVDRREVVRGAVLRLRDEALLRLPDRRLRLRVERRAQRGLFRLQLVARLRGGVRVGCVYQRHRRDLDVLHVGDEIRRRERARHDSLGNLTHLGRALARLVHGVHADRGQREKRQDD